MKTKKKVPSHGCCLIPLKNEQKASLLLFSTRKKHKKAPYHLAESGHQVRIEQPLLLESIVVTCSLYVALAKNHLLFLAIQANILQRNAISVVALRFFIFQGLAQQPFCYEVTHEDEKHRLQKRQFVCLHL